MHLILLGCQAPKQPTNRNLGVHLFIIRNICNYTHLPTTPRSLHNQLLDVLPVGHANHANHLVLGEYRSDRNLLLETAPGKVSLDKRRIQQKLRRRPAIKSLLFYYQTQVQKMFVIQYSQFSQSSWGKLRVRKKKSPVTKAHYARYF